MSRQLLSQRSEALLLGTEDHIGERDDPLEEALTPDDRKMPDPVLSHDIESTEDVV